MRNLVLRKIADLIKNLQCRIFCDKLIISDCLQKNTLINLQIKRLRGLNHRSAMLSPEALKTFVKLVSRHFNSRIGLRNLLSMANMAAARRRFILREKGEELSNKKRRTRKSEGGQCVSAETSQQVFFPAFWTI